jgi:hypothetical protein
MLANLFVYMTLACSAALAVAFAKSTLTQDRRTLKVMRLTVAAAAAGTVACFFTAVGLAGLLTV